MSSIVSFIVSSSKRNQMIDITNEIHNIVTNANIRSGICTIFVPHTTCAISINENADPDVKKDLIFGLNNISPEDPAYGHIEGNSDAHIKTSLVGCSETIIIDKGKLILGMWQGIYFCEFDGPRKRKVLVKILEDN